MRFSLYLYIETDFLQCWTDSTAGRIQYKYQIWWHLNNVILRKQENLVTAPPGVGFNIKDRLTAVSSLWSKFVGVCFRGDQAVIHAVLVSTFMAGLSLNETQNNKLCLLLSPWAAEFSCCLFSSSLSGITASEKQHKHLNTRWLCYATVR